MPPIVLIRFAVALVWIYEGLWCKILGRMPHQEQIVDAVPIPAAFGGQTFLFVLGLVECAIGIWVLSGWQAWWAALLQTVLLVAMNSVGITFARRLIHDPGGMVAKNFALLVLAWVAAAPEFS